MHLYKQDVNHLDCELKKQQGERLGKTSCYLMF